MESELTVGPVHLDCNMLPTFRLWLIVYVWDVQKLVQIA